MCLSALEGFAVHSSDELCRQQYTVGQGSKEVAWLPKGGVEGRSRCWGESRDVGVGQQLRQRQTF